MPYKNLHWIRDSKKYSDMEFKHGPNIMHCLQTAHMWLWSVEAKESLKANILKTKSVYRFLLTSVL